MLPGILLARLRPVLNSFFHGGDSTGFFMSTNVSSSGTFGPAILARRVLELLRKNTPGSTQLGEVLGLVDPNPRINPPAAPHVNLSGPEIYLRFFVAT